MDVSVSTPVVSFDQPDLNGISLIDTEAGMRARYLVTALNPINFSHYLDEAERAYGRYGVASAVRRVDLERESCPAFWQIEDLRSGQLMGGVRNHGPYLAVDQVWAWQELAGSGRSEELVPLIDSWIKAGTVIEQKGAYVHTDLAPGRARNMAAMFKRLSLVSVDMIRAGTMVASSAEHTLPLWRACGFEVICPDIVAPYPDARYQTVLIANRARGRQQRVAPELVRQAELDLLSLYGQMARERLRSRPAEAV